MPDTRRHRGPHPADADLFGRNLQPVLRQAVSHLAWLLTREYPNAAALKLVGDRFQLSRRQRIAVQRSSCSDQSRDHRSHNRIPHDQFAGQSVAIDGFNLITTIEAALSGGVILRGRDGCCRDMASMHGNYRKVEETRPAIERIGRTLADCRIAGVRWYLDRPVSNSGRLCTLIRETAAQHNWPWSVELVPDPDRLLSRSRKIVATADSAILDLCSRWCNLACRVIQTQIPAAVILSLNDPSDG